jgi:hypothetical protein
VQVHVERAEVGGQGGVQFRFQLGRVRLPGQGRLGQGRPVVGRAPLGGQHGDRPLEAAGPEFLDRAETGQSPASDNDLHDDIG